MDPSGWSWHKIFFIRARNLLGELSFNFSWRNHISIRIQSIPDSNISIWTCWQNLMFERMVAQFPNRIFMSTPCRLTIWFGICWICLTLWGERKIPNSNYSLIIMINIWVLFKISLLQNLQCIIVFYSKSQSSPFVDL